MNAKTTPFTKEQLETIIAQYPTPFHIYDAKGIMDNMRAFLDAFSWAPGVQTIFCCESNTKSLYYEMMKEIGIGADCSSMAELILSERWGSQEMTSCSPPMIRRTKNTKKAMDLGAIINLDDITHIAYLEQHGELPDRFCFRYNPGSLKEGGNTIIGLPEEAKYGMTEAQIMEAINYLKGKGITNFGLHTMVVSNELDVDGLVGTAELMFNLALRVKEQTGVEVSFIDLGGGIGVAYKPEQTPVDYKVLSAGVKAAYDRLITGTGHSPIQLAYECGRMVTGPYGYLVATAIHKKDIYKHYIGLDACMSNLMRPALYGSYHHITVMGKENEPANMTYDVTGSLCENNDKFAIDRQLPKIDMGDRIVIHDAGAHGHAMGFNYNGKLRSAELLLHEDGSVTQIRRAETLDDYFATLDFSNL